MQELHRSKGTGEKHVTSDETPSGEADFKLEGMKPFEGGGQVKNWIWIYKLIIRRNPFMVQSQSAAAPAD